MRKMRRAFGIEIEESLDGEMAKKLLVCGDAPGAFWICGFISDRWLLGCDCIGSLVVGRMVEGFRDLHQAESQTPRVNWTIKN